MGTDPAMLVWLDTNTSTKASPNENYAREVMELFSLGVGNYTEADIRQAARAFTGYEIKEGKGALNRRQHDTTEKEVFGKKGKFTGEDIAGLCLDHGVCARFIVRKLYRFLVSEADNPGADLIDPSRSSTARATSTPANSSRPCCDRTCSLAPRRTGRRSSRRSSSPSASFARWKAPRVRCRSRRRSTVWGRCCSRRRR